MTLWGDRWQDPFTPVGIFHTAHSCIAGLALTLGIFALGARLALAEVHASIVVDAQTGTVLESHNADKLAHPASLAKLMTLYITFQRLDSGKLTLDKQMRVSRHASAQQATRLGLRAGSSISVRSAILGIVTKSANDAAVVLAEDISGSEARFAGLMTRTAHQLGMLRTHFYNASGLPDARQWTTARDMSKLALAIIGDFPAYYHFFDVRSFLFHGRRVYGHDHLLDLYAGADGLKTGYIRTSGYNLVTSAVRHRRRLVGVVMGGATARARDRYMMTLLDRSFSMRAAPLEAARSADHSKSQRHAEASVKFASDEVRGDDEDAAGSHWVVQVGCDFSSAQSVRRVLESAVRTAPASLSKNKELVVKLPGAHYRARFSQLTKGTAIKACRTLSRTGFTCRFFDAPSSADSHMEASLAHSTEVHE